MFKRREFVKSTGIGQIVCGTDMPFPWPINPDTILNNRLLNNAEKEAILGGNLVKLLKLSPAATA